MPVTSHENSRVRAALCTLHNELHGKRELAGAGIPWTRSIDAGLAGPTGESCRFPGQAAGKEGKSRHVK